MPLFQGSGLLLGVTFVVATLAEFHGVVSDVELLGFEATEEWVSGPLETVRCGE